jgi:plasmid stabilization system protein ParE
MLFPIKFAHVHEAVVTRFPYVINYEVLGKEIIVSAIFHVKQHPNKKVKRKRK